MYTEKSIASDGSASDTKNKQVEEFSDFPYGGGERYIEDIHAFCKTNSPGYRLETMSTPAGDLTVCRVEFGGSTSWYSDKVPFGLVKEITHYPGILYSHLDLISFNGCK